MSKRVPDTWPFRPQDITTAPPTQETTSMAEIDASVAKEPYKRRQRRAVSRALIEEVEKNRKLRETLERIRSKTLANVSDCFLHGYVMETIDAVLREMEASKTGGAG